MATVHSQAAANASNVYLFKNGYGMIVKTFEFPSSNDQKSLELIDPPSNAVHGTFWIQSRSNNISISSIRTKKTRKLIDKECLTVEDLIEANVGEDVQLYVTDKISTNNEWISGKIKSAKRIQQNSEDDDNNVARPSPAPVPIHPSFSAMPTVCHRPTTTIQQGNLVVLETTNDGLLAMPLSNVQSIRSATLKTTYQQKVFTNCLSIDFKNESKSNDIGLMKYLTFGLTWVPSYNLVLSSSNQPTERKLHLSAKAVILNDIENLHVEHLFCIVGFPNISKFASVIDPILSGENVNDFLEKLKQCENARSMNSSSVMSNSVMTQQIMMPMTHSNNPIVDNSHSDTNTDDLHLYEFQNVLLQKKERLMLPIFEIELPYKDIYHCQIDGSQLGNIYAAYEEKKEFEEVWHSVEFENLSNFVWTTAPVLITKGLQEQQFIGLDKITYTLKGSTTVVNLTKALDVRVQLDERIANTDPTRFTLFRSKYQTDHIDGKILIMNYKSEAVVVVLKISLLGKLGNCSLPPTKDAIKAANRDVANQQHDLQWEVTVKSKQTLEIKYTRSFNKRV